jgi:hypothetical protein
MWIFPKDGFLALKQHNANPRLLVVRGRIRGDIERLMGVPSRQVIEDAGSDYRFRSFLDRDRVADRIAEHVRAINYDSGFKSAVIDKCRAKYYFSVWDTCYLMQEELSVKPKPPKRPKPISLVKLNFGHS